MNPSISFIICTERGPLETMSVLLAKSLRTLGGRLRDAPLLSYQPRPGRDVSPTTRAAFDRLQVEHYSLPLNAAYAEHSHANKPLVGEYAERHLKSDFLVFLDSDKLIVQEPSALILSSEFDVGIRPADLKGIGASDEQDPNYPFWRDLYELLDVQEARYITTTADSERILGYWNSGLITVRRTAQLFSRWAENLRKVLARNLTPANGKFRDQYSLAPAIITSGVRLATLPVGYNYPVHLHHRLPRHEQLTSLGDVATLHYHQMFTKRTARHPLADVFTDWDGAVGEWLNRELSDSNIRSEHSASRLTRSAKGLSRAAGKILRNETP